MTTRSTKSSSGLACAVWMRFDRTSKTGACRGRCGGRETFENVWKHEVDPKEGKARTFTEGARGKMFRLDGIIGDALVQGWDVVPPNPWRIHDFTLVTILADDYRQVAVRFFSPFTMDELKDIEGRRKEYVRLYGMFIKNHTYRTRYKDPKTGQPRLLTVPMFVLLRADRVPAPGDSMMTAMYWIAAGMLLCTLLFYIFVVRAGRRQQAALEAKRQRMRAKRMATSDS